MGLLVIFPLTQIYPQLKVAENVVTQIEVIQTEYRSVDPLSIRFSVTNNSDKQLHILKWNTPLEGINADVFNILKDEKPVVYIGRVIKRGNPQPEDYVSINANDQVSVEIDLSDAYDIYEAGSYDIEFNTLVLDIGYEAPAVLMAKEKPEQRLLRSNKVKLNLIEDKASKALPKELPEEDISLKAPVFKNCSQSQRNTLNTALSNAKSYTSYAQLALLTCPVSKKASAPRYLKWFGTYTAARYNKVSSNYQKIYDALSTKTITFHCDCNENYYAYVYPNKPYHIYLCNAFWSAPAIGTDCQFGVIIHEISHFYVVTSTKDHAYGHANCQTLANTDPAKAIENADSYEYFAENKPPLKMGLNLTVYCLMLVGLLVIIFVLFRFRKWNLYKLN